MSFENYPQFSLKIILSVQIRQQISCASCALPASRASVTDQPNPCASASCASILVFYSFLFFHISHIRLRNIKFSFILHYSIYIFIPLYIHFHNIPLSMCRQQATRSFYRFSLEILEKKLEKISFYTMMILHMCIFRSSMIA